MPLAVFKRGSKGPFVAEIQTQLNIFAGFDLNRMYGNGSSKYAPLVEDGKYGKKTSDRVKEFQMWNPPLKVDGKVGPNTWAKMTGKFWTPEVAKAAAMESVAAAIAAADPGPPEEGYLYVYQAMEYKAEKASGRHLHKPGHDPAKCHHFYVEKCAGLAQELGDLVNEENILIKEMFIACHGGGGGSVFLGNEEKEIHFSNRNNLRLFEKLVGRFAPGGVISIYACSFASYRGQNNNTFDHDLVSAPELIYAQLCEGRGVDAMRNIANYTGCEVRAGLDSQTKNFDGFRALWIAVKPGERKARMYMNGRLMQSLDGLTTFQTEQFAGALVKMYTWVQGL